MKTGRLYVMLRKKSAEGISKETDFRIDGNLYGMKSISDIPEKVSEAMPEYAVHIGLYNEDSWTYSVALNADLNDGIYETEVITKSVSPIFLLVN